jgi:hypothetical protein
METAGHPPNLTGDTFGQHGHICAFFNSIDEQHRVLRPFVARDPGAAAGPRGLSTA